MNLFVYTHGSPNTLLLAWILQDAKPSHVCFKTAREPAAAQSVENTLPGHLKDKKTVVRDRPAVFQPISTETNSPVLRSKYPFTVLYCH